MKTCEINSINNGYIVINSSKASDFLNDFFNDLLKRNFLYSAKSVRSLRTSEI